VLVPAPGAGTTERRDPRQAIEIVGRIRGASRRDVRRRTGGLLAALDIEEWADRPGEQLSGGVRRLTAFCMSIVEPGRLVMLDEPTNDVDPVRRRLLWDQVRNLARDGYGVVLVTDNVAETKRAIDRIAVLNHGRIAAAGTPAALATGQEGRRWVAYGGRTWSRERFLFECGHVHARLEAAGVRCRQVRSERAVWCRAQPASPPYNRIRDKVQDPPPGLPVQGRMTRH
jgi:ABC-type multidrug transport system ATPase subunit